MSTSQATLESPAKGLRGRGGARSSGQTLARRERWIDVAVVVGPALLGLGLCLYQLTTRSLWLDESAAVAIASQHGAAFGRAVAHDGGNMLAFYALLHVLIGWFGSGALVIRLPSVMAATATVALVGVLGLRLAGRRVALIAGLLTGVSLTLVYWGQDARGYIPMVAMVAASFLCLLALLQKGGWVAWVAYVLTTTAAIYLGLEAVLVVPAQLVALVWFRERWRSLLSAVAVSAAACVPLAVLAANRGSGQLFWVPKPNLRVLGQIVQLLTSSGLQPGYYTATTTGLLVLTLVLLAGAAARIWWLARRAPGRAIWGPALMLSWLLVPAIVALIESTLGQSIFQPRYMMVSLPAVSLVLGFILADPRLPRLLSLGLVAGLIALRALQLAPAYGASSENWRGLTAYVVRNARTGDCVAFYPLDNRQAFRYYLRDFARAPTPILPSLPWRQVRPFVEDYGSLGAGALARLPQRCGRVWLTSSHEGRVGGPTISKANYARFLALTQGLRRDYPIVSRTRPFSQRGVITLTLYSR